MYRLLICITLSGTLILSACASTTAETLPTLENTWTVEMTHSGGIAGISRSIEIASDGGFTVLDNQAGTNRVGQLAADELEELKEIVDSTQYSTVSKETGCADCFVYDIAIAGTGKPFKARVDDVNMEESGLVPLVMILRTIMERELN
jgi:hypothetical protein